MVVKIIRLQFDEGYEFISAASLAYCDYPKDNRFNLFSSAAMLA